MRKILLSADNLILKHNIKLDNKHDLKFAFQWDGSFRIQRANSIKKIYILKEMNKTRLERTYANNRLKQFKIRNTEDSSTKQIEIRKILNITSENSTDKMKKLNIINKDVRVTEETRSEAARNTAKNLNEDDQIFRNMTADNDLSNSKTRNIHATDKFSARRSNWSIEIESLLNKIDRKKNTAAFAAIDKVSIEKECNAIEIEDFETYINNCNTENSLIVSLISRNRLFAIRISFTQSTLTMNYVKKKDIDIIAMIENTNFNTSAVALVLLIL